MRLSAAAAAAWLAAASAGLACRSETPAPTKVEDPSALVGPGARAERDSPFSNPNEEPPPARSEPQLAAAELEPVLAEARRLAQADEVSRALIELRKCANKVPQHVECETLMALVLLEHRLHRPHALYFLAEAVKADDPAVTSDQLRTLARLAANDARFAEAARALQIVRDRGDATADDWYALAQALQADPANHNSTLEALAKVSELDPKRHDALRERAVLHAQAGEREQALELFRRYRGAIASDAKEAEAIDKRIAALERELGQ